MGDGWVNLGLCLGYGNVGCCDGSNNKHATAHNRETGHPVIQSHMPGQSWRFCYVEELTWE
jgi:uncharacterized UBP type Zn finger protein|tara:strand:- start:295 stop:477 length:183 start_codon:yes stop_codon:yes gene_type:complete